MEGLFKTAVGGFKKEDVLAYIDKQETNFKAREKELKNRISQLETSEKEEKDRSRELGEKLEALQLTLNLVQQQKDTLEQSSAEAAETAESLKGALNQAEAVNESQKHEISRLTQLTAEAKNQLTSKDSEVAGLQETVRELNITIDKLSHSEDRVGRVLIEAQNTADKMLQTAKSESGKLLSEAREKLAVLLSQAEDFRQEVGQVRRVLADFSGSTDSALETIENSAEELRKKYTDEFEEKAVSLLEQPKEKLEVQSEQQAQTASAFDFSQNSPSFNWNCD